MQKVFICVFIYLFIYFAIKAKLLVLKFEFCQIKLN